MNSFKLIVSVLISAFFLIGCSTILEDVSFLGGKPNVETGGRQEEFDINTKSLTFKTAKEANKSKYSRQLIFTGSGSKANVLDEVDFLTSNFPKSLNSPNYLLGVGDQVTLIALNEFEAESVQWPDITGMPEYYLGAGDELTFVQSNDASEDISYSYNDNGQIVLGPNNDSLIKTSGVIGSTGNVLLFGLGNIFAANRSLDDVRTEVRNILIRNGLLPNFQLEISKFQSQKAFLTISNGTSRLISLNNLPISLKEIALETGLSESNKNFALIKLTRNAKEFRFTAGQLFDLKAPEIIIHDNDQIEIQIIPNESTMIQSAVGSKGNILLGSIGSITALNRTIDDLHEEISSILIEKGIKPSFQLELTNFVSKKAYLIQKNVGNIVVPLTSSKITLRELILKNKSSVISTVGLSLITLKRNGQVFRMTGDQILDPKTQDIYIIDEDQIEVENLNYKPGQVFALSGAGRAQAVSIDPSKRETLADILFTKSGALNNLLVKRSEVYLLRGKNPSTAYHLDAQNVSRILVAAKTELRPNDIVYVADRPIISFSRTLSEILPLRMLLRDIQNNNIP